MEIPNIDALLKSCGCNNLNELWDYIDYLECVKEDYDFLKTQICNVYLNMQDLY